MEIICCQICVYNCTQCSISNWILDGVFCLVTSRDRELFDYLMRDHIHQCSFEVAHKKHFQLFNTARKMVQFTVIVLLPVQFRLIGQWTVFHFWERLSSTHWITIDRNFIQLVIVVQRYVNDDAYCIECIGLGKSNGEWSTEWTIVIWYSHSINSLEANISTFNAQLPMRIDRIQFAGVWTLANRQQIQSAYGTCPFIYSQCIKPKTRSNQIHEFVHLIFSLVF